MFDLDASAFSESIFIYEYEFERILSKLVLCYDRMMKLEINLKNNENIIRDFLLINYLKNDKVRKEMELLDYHFEREVPEDTTVGRTDIKIISKNTFEIQDAYYIIECKRLNSKNKKGSSGLNMEYINNGIFRYTSGYYKSYHRINAMIGFIVDQVDIHENVEILNELLLSSKDCRTSKKITKDSFIDGFQYHYHSEHFDSDDKYLKLYHVMLNLKDKIQN